MRPSKLIPSIVLTCFALSIGVGVLRGQSNTGVADAGVSISFQNSGGAVVGQGVGISFQSGGISVTTNLSAATFTIVGPVTYTGGGTAFSQPNAPPGQYTLTFGAVAGFNTPQQQTQTLAVGGTITFTGTYTSVLPSLSVSPSTLTFIYQKGIAGPPSPQPVTVSSTGAALSFTATATATPSGWLVVSPANGKTATPKGTLEASIRPAGLAVGTYSGQITITATGAFNSPLAVPVTLTVTPPTGTLTVTTNLAAGSLTITDAAGKPLSGATNVPVFGPTPVNVGSYSITYNAVSGYYTPLIQKIHVTDAKALDFAGYYRRLFLIGFTGYNNAPSPSNCFHVPIKFGSGVQYDPAQMNQPNMGIGTAVLNALNNELLQQAIIGTVFTFYDTGGNACAPPSGDGNDVAAGNWLTQSAPGPDDWIVIIGHSYGGNRAQLFAQQVQTQLNRPVDLLVTIDPIDWTACNIQALLIGNDGSQPCNQTLRVTPESTAQQVWAYYQTLGYWFSGAFWAVDGYIPLNALSFVNVPADHQDIENTGIVQLAISNMLLTAVNGPRINVSITSATRSDTAISLSTNMAVQPMLNIGGLTLTSATLNGTKATNLLQVGDIGDLNVGATTTIILEFPPGVGASGANGVLKITGYNILGQVVTFPSTRITLP